MSCEHFKIVDKRNIWVERVNSPLHLCALKMRMESLLFADENAPEWAFSKRKGSKRLSEAKAKVLLHFSKKWIN
jgi:hypothetical protein